MQKDDGLTNKYIGKIDQLLGRKIRQVPFLSYIKKIPDGSKMQMKNKVVRTKKNENIKKKKKSLNIRKALLGQEQNPNAKITKEKKRKTDKFASACEMFERHRVPTM